MSDWRILYRDHLDCDRTTQSIPSREAALSHARTLWREHRAEIYRIEGPDGALLPKEEIMRWMCENRR